MAITRWNPFKAEMERWEPFNEISNMQRQLNRLFDQLMPQEDGWTMRSLIPAAEMHETDEEIQLKLEVPGMDAKDLSLEVTETSVAITGERKSETKTEEKGMTHSEFRYGKLERIIPLPASIQTDKVKAEFKNGILNVTLLKAEEERKKVVKVKLS